MGKLSLYFSSHKIATLFILFLALSPSLLIFQNCSKGFEANNLASNSAASVSIPGTCGLADGVPQLLTPTGATLCQNGVPTAVNGTGPFSWTCVGSSGSTPANCSAPLMVTGICGAASGMPSTTIPVANLCSAGAASTVTGSGPWTWACAGSNGGTTADCSDSLAVNGACGSANTTAVLAAPSGAALCASGTATTVSGVGPFTWGCTGVNGGTTSMCSAILEVIGQCGTSNGANLSMAPATNLCAMGMASTVAGSGPWAWSCAGANGGTTSMCSANLTANGTCGLANGGNFAAAPTTNLCNSGSPTTVSGMGPFAWTCNGAGGGSSMACTSNFIVNGLCGTSNNTDVNAAPTTNLCATGTASAVIINSSSFSWSCAGANTGSTSQCAAQLLVNGSCGVANNANLLAAPTGASLCATGVPVPPTGTGPWNWTCLGLNTGTTSSCKANLMIVGQCGSANGTSPSTAPTTNLCVAGSASTVVGAGPWTWTCAGSNGGGPANCTTGALINGACGMANGSSVPTAPATNLCVSGNASTVAGTGPFTWTCGGSGGGTAASCSATLQINGVCGTANNTDVTVAPSSPALCVSGAASTVAGTGPFSWSCTGSGGGTSSTCSALLILNGRCGTANGAYVSAAPVGLPECASGLASTVALNGATYSWTCGGQNTGASASCSANEIVAGSCGTSNSVATPSTPVNLCSAGTASTVTLLGSYFYSWICTGLNHGAEASCGAPQIVAGACGSANGVASSTPPSTNLCSAGTTSVVATSTTWSWTCTGKNGGAQAACIAPIKELYSQIPSMTGFTGIPGAVYGVATSGTTIYLATSDGLAISTNGGSTYVTRTTADGLGSNVINSVLVSGTTIYASTTNGLSISSDGGATFVNHVLTSFGCTGPVNDSYVDGGNLYVACDSAILVSHDGGTTFTALQSGTVIQFRHVFASGANIYFTASPGGGIYESTNSGTTFARVSVFDSVPRLDQVYDFAFQGANLLAVGFDVNSINKAGLAVSTNGGAFTFNSNIVAGQGPHAISVNGTNIFVGENNGVQVSTDSGTTFALKTTANGLGAGTANKISSAGPNVYVATSYGLSSSADNGNTFSFKSNSSSLVGEHVYDIATSGSNIYVVTSWGLGVSKDNGTTFVMRGTADGLLGAPFSVYASGPSVYALTSQGLFVSADGGATFANTSVAGASNGSTVFVNGSTVYLSLSTGLVVSVDGGKTFSPIAASTNIPSTTFVSGYFASGNNLYIASASGLFVSTNGGVTFTSYTTANGLASNDVRAVYATGTTVYAATSSGLSVSSSGGNFTTITVATPIYGVYASGPSILAVGYDGVLSSSDGGVTFTNIAMPSGASYFLKFATNGTQNFIGSFYGLYRSN